MTLQEIFDKAARHLLTQKERSMIGPTLCAYRGPDGKKCAVGIFIPDEKYDPGMEQRNLSSLIVQFPDAIEGVEFINGSRFLNEKGQILTDLQETHDDVDPEHWKESLAKLAAYYHLDASVLDEFKE